MNEEFIYMVGNADHVWSKMNEAEKSLFPFEVRIVDWEKCLTGY